MSRMSLALRPPDQVEITSMAAARAALAELADLDEVRDFANRAAAAAEYFRRAKNAEAAVTRMIEVQIWAERRAGELVDEHAFNTRRADYVRGLGTTTPVVRRWLTFAKASERDVRSAIARAIDEGRQPTASGVAIQLEHGTAKRVERGIFLTASGLYVIRWRDRGVSRQKLMGNDLPSARERLLVLTGKLAEPKPTHASVVVKHLAIGRQRGYLRTDETALEVVHEAYQLLRGTLERLGDAKELPASAKAHVDDAFAALYKAEDSITLAMRILG